MATEGPLNSLLPEIYPIIAAYLPLSATPSTLLALALTNHHISEIVLPLLHSRLILRNEADAILVLHKLVDDPSFRSIVRELYIMSDLSLETRTQGPPSSVIRRVADIILQGHLPFIHTLGLHLGNWWYYDDSWEPVNGFGRFEKSFWAQIKKKCPNLRALMLEGFMEDIEEPWMDDSGILEVPDITSLFIHISGSHSQLLPIRKHLQHISSLAHSLHTLNLKPDGGENLSPSNILESDFPYLRSLSLASFSEIHTSQAMAFWERHPSIEYLDIAWEQLGRDRWFAPVVPSNLLPKLLHLKACWNDALLLAPILDRLLSLSIHDSVNAQIPYLLRSVCLDGLPKLKSLHIGQADKSTRRNRDIEGSLWYESEDGVFHRTVIKGSRTVFNGFMHSIVRAAPNLEEIGFSGALSKLPNFIQIAGDLNGFICLKRLYHYDDYITPESGIIDIRDKRDIFASEVRNLAEAVPGLVSITNMATRGLPYMAARITRGEDGEVIGVQVGNGYGMKIGHEDDAFPSHPRY